MSSCPAPEELCDLALRHLNEAQAAHLQAHVDHCPDCQEALDSWSDLLGLLPLVESPVTPPPDLKRRILADLAVEATPIAAGRAPNRFLGGIAVRWVGLVASVALLLGGYAVWQVQRLKPAPHTIALHGLGPAPGAKAHLALFKEGSGTRVAIDAEGLPPTGKDEVYQVWSIKDGQRRALCNFKVDETGYGETSYWLPRPLAYDTIGVTLEPDPYGSQPRGPKVLGY
jgi:anti-sigma-K factor RskA